MSLRFGVDVGGTKIAVAALGPDGATLGEARRPNPHDDYEGALANAREALDEAAAQAGATPARVGVGIAGTVLAAEGAVRFGNATWFWNRPVRDDLARAFGVPVRLANDADCFAVSEALDGAGAGARSVFGVILGTGVGGGFVYDGRLVTGARGIAGEIGHVPLPRADATELAFGPCNCGRYGCADVILSGPGLRASFAQRCNERLDPREIAARAENGDASCAAEMALYEERLGRFLAMLIQIVEPEAIVLGGGVSNIARLYRNLPDAIAPHLLGGSCHSRILRARHGDSSGVRGAAMLWEAGS